MDTSLISLLTGAGVAGVFCVLFVIGLVVPRSVVDDKNREIAELKNAVAEERDRADTAVAAANATRDVLAAIQFGRELPRPGGASP